MTMESYSRDPRNIARKAQTYLAATGIGDTVFFAPEAEFYVFDDVRYETNGHSSFYSVDAESAGWNTAREEERGNLGYKVRQKGGYFPVAPADHYGDLRDDIVRHCENAGLVIERAHHEVGAAGQAEIKLAFRHPAHQRRQHDEVQIPRQEHCLRQRQIGHLHAHRRSEEVV